MDKGIETLIVDMKDAALKATPRERYSKHIDTGHSEIGGIISVAII